MNLSVARIAEMFDAIAAVVTQIRLCAFGARAGVSDGSWIDIELRALYERCLDLEIALGRFKAELQGSEYVFPAPGCAQSRGKIN